MPVYNDGEYLRKSIGSVIKQTLKDVEIVCVNDGSTDDSLDVLNDLSKKYDFIKVFSQENQGSGKARNYGIDEANGEYIGFLDADDFFIDEDALERLYEVANENNANMVSGNIKLVDGEGNYHPFKDMDYYNEDSKIKPEEYGIPWAFYKSIYKKDFLMENNIYFPDLIRGQDPVFLAEVLSKVDSIFTVNTDVYAYYYIDGADKCNTFQKRHAHIEHFKYIFNYFSDPKFKEVKEQFKYKMFVFIDMMGLEGAEDTLGSIRDVFSDNPGLVKECENFYYGKFFDNKEVLNKLDLIGNPKISVIIPVYNAAPFLEEAFESVLSQNFDDIELVCVNDGSKDNSLEILNEFAKNDPRVKVIDQENGGCGAARNRALDDAIGDYIYFFDPDDYILPRTFERLFKNATRNWSDLVMFKIARFKDDGPIDYSNPGFAFEKVFKNVNFNSFAFDYHDVKPFVMNRSFAPWTKLYKREFLDQYDDFRFPTSIAYDDAPFHIQSMLRASRISYIPEFFYHYRFNPKGIINTSSNGMDIFRICDIVESFLKDNGFYFEFFEEFNLFKITQIFNYLLSTNTEEYFQKAKGEFSKIHLGHRNKVPNHLRKKYDLVLKSESLEDYKDKEYKLSVGELKASNKKLTKKYNTLKKENKKLTKEKKKAKKLNKTIASSNSWKMTKPLRNFANNLRK